MRGFGDQRPHGTYDDVAADLATAARRFAAPMAITARKPAITAQQQANANNENAAPDGAGYRSGAA